jgi:hypothetical protein
MRDYLTREGDIVVRTNFKKDTTVRPEYGLIGEMYRCRTNDTRYAVYNSRAWQMSKDCFRHATELEANAYKNGVRHITNVQNTDFAVWF